MAGRDKKTTQFLILETIDKNDHITPSKVAEELKLSFKHVVMTIKDLEDQGFIKKSKNSDKRVRLLKLTDKGKSLLKTLQSIKTYWIK